MSYESYLGDMVSIWAHAVHCVPIQLMDNENLHELAGQVKPVPALRPHMQ